MTLTPPPFFDAITNESGAIPLSWVNFFSQTFRGDAGKVWTPTFTGLTGTATITGKYFRISQYLVYFNIHIVPNPSVSATAGTTYCNNFPLRVQRNGVNIAVSGALGGGTGIVREGDNRIYIADLTAVTSPVTILGFVEAQ